MKKVMFAVVALIMSVSVAFAAEGDFLPQPVGTNGPAITAFRLSRLETELPNVEVPVRDQQKALAAVTSGEETEESEEDSEATENVESTFEIKKATTSVAEAYSSHDVGRLQIPSVGVDIAIRYSLEQADVDAVGMGASYDISVLPGDPTGSAVFGDHNFQTGKLFASVNLSTSWRVLVSLILRTPPLSMQRRASPPEENPGASEAPHPGWGTMRCLTTGAIFIKTLPPTARATCTWSLAGLWTPWSRTKSS